MSAKQSNYSFETSLPVYKENIKFHKQRQCDELLQLIKRGCDTLLQLSEISGIVQSTCAARMGDLMEEGKATYLGKKVYKNLLRKKIVITQPIGTMKKERSYLMP